MYSYTREAVPLSLCRKTGEKRVCRVKRVCRALLSCSHLLAPREVIRMASGAEMGMKLANV